MENDSTNPNQTWKFSQCFGDKGDIENITEADVISTVEFDHTGNYLATGDKGGRVVLFERNESNPTRRLRLLGLVSGIAILLLSFVFPM